jgi:hypothetical protein
VGLSEGQSDKGDDGSAVAVVGDVHGHLQLALCMVARWQEHLQAEDPDFRFEAVLLCGDVGTFVDEAMLDSATRSHAKTNECEVEFPRQWAVHPPAPWLERIFLPKPDGLGLSCPVVMVHGNHEGFAHLETLFTKRRRSTDPVPVDRLRGVDAGEFIQYLPSGWRTVLPSGRVVGGVGGMQLGQRARTRYHRLAYIEDAAVEALMDQGPVDLLITHQGPAQVQGEHGSESLDFLLDAGTARAWFHGHSIFIADPTRAGKGQATLVVPLGDIAFAGRGNRRHDPGLDGWAYVVGRGDATRVVKETPPFWRELRQSRWTMSADGRLVAPDLARFLWA